MLKKKRSRTRFFSAESNLKKNVLRVLLDRPKSHQRGEMRWGILVSNLIKIYGPIVCADGPDGYTESMDLDGGICPDNQPYNSARWILIDFETKIPQSHFPALVGFEPVKEDP